MSLFQNDAQGFLTDLFKCAVHAALPEKIIPQHLPSLDQLPKGKIGIFGAGKAAASMAAAVEKRWLADLGERLEGLVITRYGHSVSTQKVTVIEASHPTPDQAGLDGTREMTERLSHYGEDDFVLFLMSGGASSLFCLPAEGVSLNNKIHVNKALLHSGAPIHDMNVVRKHLSRVKGGQLLRYINPARCMTLAISDVVGDQLDVIGSGPTVPDTSTLEDVRKICRRYHIALPKPVEEHLNRNIETPKPEDAVFQNSTATVIASAAKSLEAAAKKAEEKGIDSIILSDSIEGEARHVADQMAKDILQKKLDRPTVFLSGGETTVTVKGHGRGGRNAEFLLALAIALKGAKGIYALAADTDGIDGVENNAGAVIAPDTLQRAQSLGMNPQAYLDNNDAYSFFDALGNLIITGPTLTNVNDFRAVLVLP